jgi:hypothetical protein
LIGYVSGFEALALQPLAHPVAGLAGVHEGIGVPVLFENAESRNQSTHKFLQPTTSY